MTGIVPPCRISGGILILIPRFGKTRMKLAIKALMDTDTFFHTVITYKFFEKKAL